MSDSVSSISADVKIKKRLAIAFFFDEEGIVDEYYFFLLKEIAKFTTRNIFVSNGVISNEAELRLRSMNYEIIIRDNIGFDVWAYKAGIEYVGYDHLGDFDEIMLFNHTFYGPIYPFEEMFSGMDARECGFWGITAHKELDPNPFTGTGILPRHLNSHFIAVRRDLAVSKAFRDYWQTMPMITSYNDSVMTHESRFTKHFEDLGYECVVYDDDHQYSSKYPCFINVDETLERRCPILKRRIFFHDPLFHEAHGIDLPHALRIMRETSDYDESLIWHNIIRTADLRTLNTTAGLTSVIPDMRIKKVKREKVKKIAVCVHIYYVDMIDEILDLCRFIKEPFDFIATTDTEAKARAIKESCANFKGIKNIIVRVLEKNRGRDMSALFISCRDLFLDDRYDLVCRLHTKKSPQVDSARSNLFKRHLFENLLHSEGYVENVIDMFEGQSWVGLAMPPAVHISYTPLGLGWFANKPRAQEEAQKLGLRVKLDQHTPVAAYGTMFWFRPQALRKLFEREWAWEDFNAEPHHVDGGLAHVLERLIAYTAQDAGYLTQQILCADQASYDYAMLEFKFSELATNIKADFLYQVAHMRRWAATGNALLGDATAAREMRDGMGFKAVWYEDDSLVDVVPTDVARAIIAEGQPLKDIGQNALIGKENSEKLAERYATLDRDIEIITDYMMRAGPLNWFDSDSSDLKDRITEYLLFGWVFGKEIFVFFDSNFYMNRYPEIAKSNINPFVHYILLGSREGKLPHPLFDPGHYNYNRLLKGLPLVTRDPVLAFLASGTEERISPHPLFDIDYYYNKYQEVEACGLNALTHYIRYGARERRQPHVLFDLVHYETGVGAQIPDDVNPLVHYQSVGARYGIDPHPLFDSLYYTESLDNKIHVSSALIHYLSVPAEQRGKPHPLFDEQWYNRMRGDGKITGTQLEHYLKSDLSEYVSTHPMFDGNAYLETYTEVAAGGMDPLVHYVKYGAWENRKVPGFDEAGYAHRAHLSKKGSVNLFVHCLKHEYAQRALREYVLI